MVALSVEGIGFGISIPSALESLGVSVRNTPLLPSREATQCGNFIE